MLYVEFLHYIDKLLTIYYCKTKKQMLIIKMNPFLKSYFHTNSLGISSEEKGGGGIKERLLLL